MAITPDLLVDRTKEIADKFEKEIDTEGTKIITRLESMETIIKIPLTSMPSYMVKEELAKRYEKAGWKGVQFDYERTGMQENTSYILLHKNKIVYPAGRD